MTGVGSIVGTPSYMAPEQHDGAETDASCDQYAFCVALWEGFAGRRPFHGLSSMSELVRAKKAGPPQEVPEAIPRRIYPVLLRGLASSPGDRFESMAEAVCADASVNLAWCEPFTFSLGRFYYLLEHKLDVFVDEQNVVVFA